MRSIRLSLVIYFLLLLAGSLGAVSWFAYETTSRALHRRDQKMGELFEAQFQAACKEEEAKLDQLLLRQAHALAKQAQTSAHYFEGLFPFGMLGAAPLMQGHLFIPLWLAEGTNPEIMARLRPKPYGFHFEPPDEEITAPAHKEFFEVFRWRSKAPARAESLYHSDSLGDLHMVLNDDLRQRAETDHFDTVDLENGLKVRRVTMKAYVLRTRASGLPIVWKLATNDRRLFPGKGPPVKGSPQRGPPNFPRGYTGFELPVIYIQYASDLSALQSYIAKRTAERDAQFADQENRTLADLESLRRRLAWIGLATFVGILLGSLVLIRLGLTPLSRLSDAVSKVSARDFRLRIDTKKLPGELIPIADRLTHTLDELRKAFAREKQAAADISHELRTPLAALLTTTEVALRKPRSVEEYREMFQDCRMSGQQMMHLVERLLALARLDAGAEVMRLAPMDVADLAHQCANLIRPLAEAKGLKLQVHSPEVLPVKGDSNKLREVVNNLLHNAIQYNKPNGSIDLTVQRENGHLLMEVRDTGIGITPAAREHIFERFYRADPSRHSDEAHAGLGLAIVKSYVDLMGGRITVDSDAGGTAFRIEVPAVDVPQESEPMMEESIQVAGRR